MRKQIAAANWKMNLTYQQAETLLQQIFASSFTLRDNQEVIFAVPAPYLEMATRLTQGKKNVLIAAQNIYSKKSGAYTGEISVEMLNSMKVPCVVLGHSERRDYFNEMNDFLAEKVDIALAHNIKVIFCCGEPLNIREARKQNEFVARQLEGSLFHLSAEQLQNVVIAYEPIWAIGTGKTATNEQAQEIQAYIRSLFEKKYGKEVAATVSILYGGSVKASNAVELFSQEDVDGGLVGGASLVAEEFVAIIKALH